MSNLARAVELAAEAYSGRAHWSGEPLLLHRLRVALTLGDPEHQIVAVLSDLPAITEAARARLRAAHFSAAVQRAVTWAQPRSGESEVDHLVRIRTRAATRLVRRAELITALARATQARVTGPRRRRMEEACRQLAILDGAAA